MKVQFGIRNWLGEVPPHSCGVPWPETIGGVAEWRCGCRDGVRVGQSFGRNGLPFPVRGCISVAEGGAMRDPNPREGIHRALAIWLAVVHL